MATSYPAGLASYRCVDVYVRPGPIRLGAQDLASGDKLSAWMFLNGPQGPS